jgi:flagellar basal body-associated protein FliL
VKYFFSKRAGWLAGLTAIALVLLATWKLSAGNRIIARGDLLLYFYPLRDYASEAIRSLRLPLWEPYTFMGAPFLANSQVGFFYPFNILTAWLPVAHAVAWNIVLHLVIATAGMYLLARHNLRLSAFASLCAAVSFGLGGYLGAQIEHLNQLQVLAWLPLQVALVLPVPTAKPRYWLSVALLSLTITLQVLAGHTQSLYICMAALAVAISGTFIARTIMLWRANHTQPQQNAGTKPVTILLWAVIPLCLLLIAGGLAALMSAVQLAPTLELASYSARSGGLTIYEVGAFSWRPWVMARALLPTYGDPLFAEYVAYLGVGGLALALLGALCVFTPDSASLQAALHKEHALLAVLLIVCGVLLALGIATPLFRLLYKLAPGFNLFRAQARWLVIFALGAA